MEALSLVDYTTINIAGGRLKKRRNFAGPYSKGWVRECVKKKPFFVGLCPKLWVGGGQKS